MGVTAAFWTCCGWCYAHTRAPPLRRFGGAAHTACTAYSTRTKLRHKLQKTERFIKNESGAKNAFQVLDWTKLCLRNERSGNGFFLWMISKGSATRSSSCCILTTTRLPRRKTAGRD